MRQNLIIPTTGNNDDGVKDGLLWLVDVGRAYGKALIAVNAFTVLERVIGRIFGESSAKSLRAGRTIVEGVRLQVMSDHKPAWDFNGPVFAVYPSAKLLDRIDDMQSVSHLLVLPWIEGEITDWARAWSPMVLGADDSEGRAAQRLISDPVVEAAMREFVGWINVGTGISHPSDKRTAIEIFRALKLNGTVYNPDEIRAWLVAERGMAPEDANDIRELAQKILEGRTVQGAGPAKKNTRWYKMWMEEAATTE